MPADGNPPELELFTILEHPACSSSIATRMACVGSEYGQFRLPGRAQAAKRKRARTWPAPRTIIVPTGFSYQGTSFFRPFFFLLLDSFLSLSLLFASLFACASAGLFASSGFAASAGVVAAAPSAVAGAAASGLAGVSAA